MSAENVDVIVIGAGLAGLCAAYELRDRSVVVLEERDRVGGRMWSGGDDDSWYNLGAQLIASPRLVALAEELGLEAIPVDEADFAIIHDGTFVRASSVERLLLAMPLSLSAKLDFGRVVLRLQRQLRKLQRMTPEELSQLDRRTLRDVCGRMTAASDRLLNEFCENNAGMRIDEISAATGLGYTLMTYVDADARKAVRGVRGGTQRIGLRLAEELPPGAVRVSSKVIGVDQEEDSVTVRYRTAGGNEREIGARYVISAVSAECVLQVFRDLPAEKKAAVLAREPQSSLITVVWPVPDDVPGPWDGVFMAPATGDSSFGLFTNYGYLAKQLDPRRGGFLSTMANGRRAAALRNASDQEVMEAFGRDLARAFPGFDRIVDRSRAVVCRWAPTGLPRFGPGSLGMRTSIRSTHGRVHFCGDYTAEPGLPGANNSGHYVGLAVLDLLAGRTAGGARSASATAGPRNRTR